jgi:putative tryptophan/tyrosine transport system substrate-binding protein
MVASDHASTNKLPASRGKNNDTCGVPWIWDVPVGRDWDAYIRKAKAFQRTNVNLVGSILWAGSVLRIALTAWRPWCYPANVTWEGWMRRREFIAGLGGAAAWPVVARAQQSGRMRRIGALQPGNESDPESQLRKAAFVDGLQKFGWTEGTNVSIHYRWVGDDADRIRLYATELTGIRPDVIWASGSLPLLLLKRATRTIPIVFTQVYDPVGSGFVTNLTRPGGNITGFTLGEFSMGGKTLEVLKEVAPQVSRVAVILNLEQPPHVAMWRSIEATAPSFGVRLTPADVPGPDEIGRVIEAFAREPNGGLIVLPSPITIVHRELITALAARHRLPAAYVFRFFVTGGGLVSYGIDPADQARQAADYVDRILKGEKPADLPIQQPTKFELVINLKTARALGLEVPQSLLARADEVIE